MLVMSGSRAILSHRLRDCNYYHYHHQYNNKNPCHKFHLNLNFYSNISFENHVSSPKQPLDQLLSPPTPPFVASFSSKTFRFLSNGSDNYSSNNDLREPFANCVHPTQKSPFPGCLSENEDCQEPPLEKPSPVAGGIVALGKFDALHIGHRELAIQASKVGVPFLLSFVGMAEVLGWEPRAPIVAKCDRKRVLSSWAPQCGNLAPREFEIEFSKVRNLTPQQFVEKLSLELGVCGVVAGENYRFGYRAAGNASDLLRLCKEYGIRAYIISSVMDKKQDFKEINSNDAKERGQVSSTRVRKALADGDMKYVSELLGRHHRLMLMIKEKEGLFSNNWVSAPKTCVLNLPPIEGSYDNCSLLIGDKNVVPCRVIIDTSHIHLELDKLATCTHFTSQDFQLIGIDFVSGIF